MTSSQIIDPRIGRLRRMRALAAGLLLAMTATFVGASLAARNWTMLAPALAYVRAFAEAAMVGACADWFAVTALFRRPLGLPIPHTAIVPRNKDRIGEALGRFIVDNFLSPRVLDAKLRDLEIAAWGADWLGRPDNARRVAARVVAWAPEVIRVLPPRALEDLAAAAAVAAARAIPASPTAAKLLAALWSDGRAQPLIERGIDLLAAYLADHETVILEAVQSRSWKWLPGWVDRAIARKITAGLLELMSEMRAPDHPWRQGLASGVEAFIARLAEDPDLRRRGEDLKQSLLNDPRVADHIRRIWSEARPGFGADWAERSDELEGRLGDGLAVLGAWLRDEPAVQRVLNTTARALVRSVLAPRRQEIGRFVARVVAGWDTKSVVERLELQIGPDLQFIRVNGTIVGGFVGLALFALTRGLGWG